MIADRKKFLKKNGSKEISVEVVGFDPSKIDDASYHSE